MPENNIRWIISGGHETTAELELLNKTKACKLYRKAFEIINARFFNNELQPIDIKIASDRDIKDNPEISACFRFSQDSRIKPQIILCFEEPYQWGITTDIINDLHHEMTHYYCYQNKINDTDENDYHNVNFKHAAENHGAKCRFNNTETGYNITTLPIKACFEILNLI